MLAYLVEGTDGAPGRGVADVGTSGAGARMHAEQSAALASPRSAPRAVRKTHRRPADESSELASFSPERALARARPPAPADDTAAASHRDAAGGVRPAAVSGNGGSATAAAGTGAGGDGDPNSVAHADYANNPPPIYPALARRREQQGTVTVRVLVDADGSVERAEVAESSGFDTLDDAALETVRSRWRFVPARHDGQSVESWVLVPIRFTLVEASAAR